MALFSKKVIEHKMRVLIFSVSFVWNISHSKNWARCDQKCILYPLFLPDFNEICIFSRNLKKNTQISNLMKIHQVGA